MVLRLCPCCHRTHDEQEEEMGREEEYCFIYPKSAHLRKSTVEEVSRLYTRFSGHRFERVDSLERGKHKDKAATTLDGA